VTTNLSSVARTGDATEPGGGRACADAATSAGGGVGVGVWAVGGVAVRGRGFHHATSFHQPSLPPRQTATAARRPDVAAHCSAAVIHAERPGSVDWSLILVSNTKFREAPFSDASSSVRECCAGPRRHRHFTLATTHRLAVSERCFKLAPSWSTPKRRENSRAASQVLHPALFQLKCNLFAQ